MKRSVILGSILAGIVALGGIGAVGGIGQPGGPGAVWAVEARTADDANTTDSTKTADGTSTVDSTKTADGTSTVDSAKTADAAGSTVSADSTGTNTTSASSAIEPTFAFRDQNSFAHLRFGNNVLTAGNNTTVDDTVKGLLFSFGNNFDIRSTSATNFVAGNAVQYHGKTTGDLFIAGNLVTIASDSAIGGSIFGAGNEFIIAANLSGDLSLAANKVVLQDGVEIAGNVNLDVSELVVEGSVVISGTLTYNDTATISGVSGLTYAELSTYTPDTYSPTASDLFAEMLAGLVSLALVTIILILAFPASRERIAAQTSSHLSARAFLIGLGVMFVVPIVAIFCLFSLIGAAAGLVLLVLYALVFYLATGFAGAWLGNLIVEKIAHGRVPFWLEALLGITILSLAGMIPTVGAVIKMAAMLLGVGLMIGCLRPSAKAEMDADASGAKSTGSRASGAQAGSKATGAKSAGPAKIASKATDAQSAAKSRSHSTKQK